MNFGVIFQESYLGSENIHNRKTKMLFHVLRLLWVFMTMIVVMSYVGNIKSSLVIKNYEKPTKTIEEIVDKDLTHHAVESTYYYLKSPIGQLSPVNRRLLCHTEKKNSIIYYQYVMDNHEIQNDHKCSS